MAARASIFAGCSTLSLLSGANTPIESMPPLLQTNMSVSSSTHFLSFAQAILFGGPNDAV